MNCYPLCTLGAGSHRLEVWRVDGALYTTRRPLELRRVRRTRWRWRYLTPVTSISFARFIERRMKKGGC